MVDVTGIEPVTPCLPDSHRRSNVNFIVHNHGATAAVVQLWEAQLREWTKCEFDECYAMSGKLVDVTGDRTGDPLLAKNRSPL